MGSAMTPGQLYDALDYLLDGAPLHVRMLPRRPVVWLTRPQARIGARTWRSVRTGPQVDEYGYTYRQARQMQRELREIMARDEERVRRLLRDFSGSMGL